MKQVTMLEFRRDAEGVIRKVQRSQGMVLTYRGKPVMKLQPIDESESKAESGRNSLLSLCELGERLVPPGPETHLTNEEIDRIVYGF